MLSKRLLQSLSTTSAPSKYLARTVGGVRNRFLSSEASSGALASIGVLEGLVQEHKVLCERIGTAVEVGVRWEGIGGEVRAAVGDGWAKVTLKDVVVGEHVAEVVGGWEEMAQLALHCDENGEVEGDLTLPATVKRIQGFEGYTRAAMTSAGGSMVSGHSPRIGEVVIEGVTKDALDEVEVVDGKSRAEAGVLVLQFLVRSMLYASENVNVHALSTQGAVEGGVVVGDGGVGGGGGERRRIGDWRWWGVVGLGVAGVVLMAWSGQQMKKWSGGDARFAMEELKHQHQKRVVEVEGRENEGEDGLSVLTQRAGVDIGATKTDLDQLLLKELHGLAKLFPTKDVQEACSTITKQADTPAPIHEFCQKTQ